MPRVPTYQPFQVQPSVGPGPAFSGPRGPGAAEIAGEQLQQMGQAIGQAGQVLGKFALAEQEKINTARLRQAQLEFINVTNEAEIEMREYKGAALIMPGENGMAKIDEITQRVLQRREEIRNSIAAPIVQREFDLEADKVFLQYNGRSLAFESEQKTAYENVQRDGLIAHTQSVGLLDPTFVDEQTGKSVWDTLDSLLREKAEAAGLDPNDEVTMGVFVREQMASTIQPRVTELLESQQIPAAEALYEATKMRLDPLERAGLKSQLDAAKRSFEVRGIVDEMVGTMTERQAYAAVNDYPVEIREQIEQRIAVVYGRNDDLKSAEATRLHERLSDGLRNEETTIDEIKANRTYMSILSEGQLRDLEKTALGTGDMFDEGFYSDITARINTPGISASELRELRNEVRDNYDLLGRTTANSLINDIDKAIADLQGPRDVPDPAVTDTQAINAALNAVGLSQSDPAAGRFKLQYSEFDREYRRANNVDRVPSEVRDQYLRQQTVRLKWSEGGQAFYGFQMETMGGAERFDITGVPNQFESTVVGVLVDLGYTQVRGQRPSRRLAQRIHQYIINEYNEIRRTTMGQAFPETPSEMDYYMIAQDLVQRGVIRVEGQGGAGE